MTSGITLSALDGSNPLAFLAALGTFRLLTLSDRDANVQMCWERIGGFWRPRLRGIETNESGLCELLFGEHDVWAPAEEFIAKLGKNLTVSPDAFRPFAKKANENATLQDRRTADFSAAFGCEICEKEDKDRIEYTSFCFITGSGHQDFLGTIASLEKNITAAHLYDSLFSGWRAARGLSMRWDPLDASEYALQWDDPGPKGAWAVWGANRLAIEALPLFPTAPVKDGLQTTGFRYRNRQNEFTWPIWEHYISLSSVRSLVSFAKLQEDELDRKALCAMGIKDVYRAQRIRIGQGANFKVSFRPARAV